MSLKTEMSDQEMSTLSSNEDSIRNYENPSPLKISALYLDTEMADVHFLLGDEQQPERIPGHKSILSVGSDVFKAMFFGELKEEGDIRIVDASVAAFEEFLQYFYLNTVKTAKSNVCDVVNLGKKYNAVGCLRICEKRLCDDLSHENVCSSYDLAILFDLEQLKQHCELLISAKTEDVLESSEFVNCSRNVLGHILKLDRFSCPETKVFKACLAWVEENFLHSGMIRDHLGDLFYDIRFGAMTIGEFSALLPSYQHLFLVNEYAEIIQVFGSEEFRPQIFERRSRHVPSDENRIVECNRVIPNDSITIPAYCRLDFSETSTFSVNQTVLIDGFTHAQIRARFGSSISGTVTLCQWTDERKFQIIHEQDIDLLSDVYRYVRFLYPVLIKPGFKHMIRFNRDPPYHNSQYKCRRLLAEVKLDSGLDVQFHDGTPKGFITDLKLIRVPHNFGIDV